QTMYEEAHGRFSPDGHWIAYDSDESGHSEIYVQPFPGPGRKWQISTNMGCCPVWRNDGKELFYITTSDRVMAVQLTLGANPPRAEAGTPMTLFTPRPGSSFGFAPSADGQRFLISTPLEDATFPPITIVLNWAGRKK